MSSVRSFLDAEMNASGTEIESRIGELGLNAYVSEPVRPVVSPACGSHPEERGERRDLIRRGESSVERSLGVPCASS